MKMVKSLLLGSAAGVVAVTMGQAADLPVKAKPVEYVKICSLYGAGFYYMPGTDMCIKIGGWVRAEANMSNSQTGSLAWGPFNGDLYQRTTNHFQVRARGYITADAREQTAYGTARGYIAVGTNNNDIGSAGEQTFNANRAFVQWAGFTAGLSQSFYDFYSAAAALYRAGFIPSSDTGDAGWFVWGYTAQLGNGVSATLSAEVRRQTQIIFQGNLIPGATEPDFGTGITTYATGQGYGGQQAPDVVGNIRVDQTWGGAQAMAAWHDVNPLYYAGETNLAGIGHPEDKSGWVVGAGLRLNAPFITQGDYFQSQVNYTQGAMRYLNNGQNTDFFKADGNEGTFGVMSDCVYGNGEIVGGVATNTTGCELTTGWGFNASFEHYWTPALHQSLAGGYMAVRYNDQANAMLCALGGDGHGDGSTAFAHAGCDMNWNFWGIGSRLQWDVTKSFYVGVEVLYDHMDGAHTSDGLLHGFNPQEEREGVLFVKNHNDAWSANVRMHKDFLP